LGVPDSPEFGDSNTSPADDEATRAVSQEPTSSSPNGRDTSSNPTLSNPIPTYEQLNSNLVNLAAITNVTNEPISAFVRSDSNSWLPISLNIGQTYHVGLPGAVIEARWNNGAGIEVQAIETKKVSVPPPDDRVGIETRYTFRIGENGRLILQSEQVNSNSINLAAITNVTEEPVSAFVRADASPWRPISLSVNQTYHVGLPGSAIEVRWNNGAGVEEQTIETTRVNTPPPNDRVGIETRYTFRTGRAGELYLQFEGR